MKATQFRKNSKEMQPAGSLTNIRSIKKLNYGNNSAQQSLGALCTLQSKRDNKLGSRLGDAILIVMFWLMF